MVRTFWSHFFIQNRYLNNILCHFSYKCTNCILMKWLLSNSTSKYNSKLPRLILSFLFIYLFLYFCQNSEIQITFLTLLVIHLNLKEGNPDYPGIVPRTIEALFKLVVETNHSFLISFSMLEIYLGNLKDLLTAQPTKATDPMPPRWVCILFCAKLIDFYNKWRSKSYIALLLMLDWLTFITSVVQKLNNFLSTLQILLSSSQGQGKIYLTFIHHFMNSKINYSFI